MPGDPILLNAKYSNREYYSMVGDYETGNRMINRAALLDRAGDRSAAQEWLRLRARFLEASEPVRLLTLDLLEAGQAPTIAYETAVAACS